MSAMTPERRARIESDICVKVCRALALSVLEPKPSALSRALDQSAPQPKEPTMFSPDEREMRFRCLELAHAGWPGLSDLGLTEAAGNLYAFVTGAAEAKASAKVAAALDALNG